MRIKIPEELKPPETKKKPSKFKVKRKSLSKKMFFLFFCPFIVGILCILAIVIPYAFVNTKITLSNTCKFLNTSRLAFK